MKCMTPGSCQQQSSLTCMPANTRMGSKATVSCRGVQVCCMVQAALHAGLLSRSLACLALPAARTRVCLQTCPQGGPCIGCRFQCSLPHNRRCLLPMQVRLIASMLSPMLEVIQKLPHLADPAAAPTASSSSSTATSTGPPAAAAGGGSTSNGNTGSASVSVSPGAPSSVTGAVGPSGGPSSRIAAAAAALLQLRLLEVFFFLPGPQFWPQCHGHLLHLCCRQLMGTGGSKVNPGEQHCPGTW